MTSVVVADDHPVVRAGLCSVIDGREGFNVIAEANDGVQTLRLVERLKPDLLVIDLSIPALNGIEVVRRIRERVATRILMVSIHTDEAYVVQALRAGAHGYVRKSDPLDTFVAALDTVRDGQQYLPPDIADLFITPHGTVREDVEDPYMSLTDREREVLHMAAEGRTNREIAEMLSISFRTVEIHRSSAMKKLGLQRQSDLVRFALRRGIIELE